jgi:uncharacterized glyoxalase superfamily protein PhnB
LSLVVFFTNKHDNIFSITEDFSTSQVLHISDYLHPLLLVKNKMKKYLIIVLILPAYTLIAQNNSTNKPITMETVSPNIFVNDIQATVKFYEILGFTVITAVPEQKNPIFVMMTCGSVTFMFQTYASIESTLPLVNRSNGGSLLLYIKVKNIRTFFEKVNDKVTVLQGLEKTFYGATEFSIKDNNNYMLTFAEDE